SNLPGAEAEDAEVVRNATGEIVDPCKRQRAQAVIGHRAADRAGECELVSGRYAEGASVHSDSDCVAQGCRAVKWLQECEGVDGKRPDPDRPSRDRRAGAVLSDDNFPARNRCTALVGVAAIKPQRAVAGLCKAEAAATVANV